MQDLDRQLKAAAKDREKLERTNEKLKLDLIKMKKFSEAEKEKMMNNKMVELVNK